MVPQTVLFVALAVVAVCGFSSYVPLIGGIVGIVASLLVLSPLVWLTSRCVYDVWVLAMQIRNALLTVSQNGLHYRDHLRREFFLPWDAVVGLDLIGGAPKTQLWDVVRRERIDALRSLAAVVRLERIDALKSLDAEDTGYLDVLYIRDGTTAKLRIPVVGTGANGIVEEILARWEHAEPPEVTGRLFARSRTTHFRRPS